MNCILKRFILKKLNKLLEEYKENVGKARGTVNLWLARGSSIVKCLESISEKLEDNQLTADELQEATDELKNLMKDW